MAEPTESELNLWIATAADAARNLQHLFETEEIYVTAFANSFVPFSHLTKAFQVQAAVLALCRLNFGSEAYALSRLVLEMHITLRWITNQDEVTRAEDYAYFVAKRKDCMAQMIVKYQQGTPQAAEATAFVEKLYKEYADEYKRFTFWSNKPSNLRELAEEKEVLYGPQPDPHNDAIYDYELPYSLSSDHIHCTALALDTAFPTIGAPYKISAEKEPGLIRDAVFTATSYLFQIARRVSTYRRLGLEAGIEDAYKPLAKLVDPAMF